MAGPTWTKITPSDGEKEMYEPILPVPQDSSFAQPELSALASVWNDRRESLEVEGTFQEFLRRMQREWAIETGIIERLYQWDRGVTELLIEHGVEATIISHRGGLPEQRSRHVANVIQDQLDVVDGLFAFVKGEQQLTEHYIRSIHQQLTAHQERTEARTPSGETVYIELRRGEYKKHPNSPRKPDGSTHHYCPPELVTDEMQRLVTWYQEASDSGVPPEVLAAWLHHRFTQIHPFQDGNGRVARALGSIVFLKHRLFPLVVRDKDRTPYLDSLEAADRGELRPLITLFAQRQQSAILDALNLERDAHKAKYAEQILESAFLRLKSRAAREKDRLNAVFETAAELGVMVQERLLGLKSILDETLTEIGQGDVNYWADVKHAADNEDRAHYFYNQIVDAARQLNYFANTNTYRSWTRLAISTRQRFELVVSFHGYGHEFQGVLAASAFTSLRIPREDGGTEFSHVRPASTSLFQFNYQEPLESTKSRFSHWLESSLAIALTEWSNLLDTP
ncbi:MAG: filamentation induced by cAMP protein fic [Deltaproteobacteria bacterium CG_4_9_14_3_um_filter_63_12]|nr:MAG: filamentation induced by cAMP protein fic [Deltaproteobacteria bacterium CG17_big_fil_post_rev_8_21_14_2_50_63_7]PJB43439.1 MAG: filamentation induced by cAMP protein fic [Deltaproteobacteria bacterium CG_4_9_14_3_um_filter_63_12]